MLEAAEGTFGRQGETGVAELGVLMDSPYPLLVCGPARVTFGQTPVRFLSGLAVRVLGVDAGVAVRTGTRVCLASDVHPVVQVPIERVELPDREDPAGGAEPAADKGRKPYPSVDDVQRVFGVTWAQIVELEPRVETLLPRARRASVACRTLGDVDRVFGPLRNELAGLIGFAGEHRRHPLLGSDGAFEVAYWTLYNAAAALLPGPGSSRE
jgi:hypothetical protein